MRKRVILSLVSGALAVMLISFIVLTPVFFFTFQNDAINELHIEMQDNINHIKPLAKMSLSFRTSKMDRLFNESMKQITYFTKSNILFMDTSGNVIWANNIVSADKMKEHAKNALSELGDNNSIKKTGLLDEIYGEKTITIGEYLTNDHGQNAWVVFCSQPSPRFSQHFKLVLWEIILIELITLTFVAIFMFLFSRNITVPLKKINNALKEFAKGDFSRRIEYKHNNEIGELASNINYLADSIGALEKMRQDFVSDISHELRTPKSDRSHVVL